MNKLEKNNNKTFEDIKHIDENEIEFWYARELMSILQYANCGFILFLRLLRSRITTIHTKRNNSKG